MKKYIYAALIVFSGVTLFESFKPLKVLKKDGAAPGYTGSPGDSLKNCTSCHGGRAVKVSGWITSNIPATGYTPGQTYTITTTNTEADGTRFGFEVSPQNTAGDLLGTLVITDTAQTQLVGQGKYITYTANGVDGFFGAKTWNFNWIAPPKGTKDVTFYGAYNSNFEGHKDGDKTFVSSLTVKEVGSIGVADVAGIVNVFSMFPNPANDHIYIQIDLNEPSNLLIDIADISGKQLTIIAQEKQTGKYEKQFNTQSLPNGNYFVRVFANGKMTTQKLAINHSS
jgi:hypothetical protein